MAATPQSEIFNNAVDSMFGVVGCRRGQKYYVKARVPSESGKLKKFTRIDLTGAMSEKEIVRRIVQMIIPNLD